MFKHLHRKVKENTGMTGVYTITRSKLKTKDDFELHDKIVHLKNKEGVTDRVLDLIRQLNNRCAVEKLVFRNLVPTVARAAIANHLTSASPTVTALKVTHIALGSSGTAPANGDTTLGTEVYRNAVASLTNSNNIGYITGFFNATETTGTYAEVGAFIEGTGSADTGTLLSHSLITVTKSSTETLTIDFTITIT